MHNFKSLIFISLLALLVACSFSNSKDTPKPVPTPTPVPVPTPTPPPTPIPTGSLATYLSLGDSYTIGESVPESGRWSVQLVEQLRSEGVGIESPDIIARTGWTTAELATAIKSSGNVKKYSMVSLLIGVNNQYRKQSIERYRTEFAELLTTAIAFANGKQDHVFVLSIPDWGVTPYATNWDPQQIGREIDAFNVVAKEECESAGVTFINVTTISRRAASDPGLIADDQLHFSAIMYRQFAEAAFPTAKKILKP